MKKLILILACLSLLTACQKDAIATVSEGETVIFQNEKTTFTKQDSFNAMKNNDYSSIIVNDILAKIAKLEGLDENELSTLADEKVAEIEKAYGDLFAQLTEAYGGLDNLKKNAVATAISEKLVNKYIADNFDQFVSENLPVKMQVAYFDSTEKAEAAKTQIENGSTFEMAVLNNGYNTEAKAKIYLDSDSLPLEVKEWVNASEALGLSDIIAMSTVAKDPNSGEEIVTARYYLVNIVERDANNFKEEFINTMIAKKDNKEALNYYFEKYDIEFHDQRTYDLVSSQYEGLK